MRILILNQSFYPDVVSVAQHAADLAECLAARGHEVTVLASRRAYTNPAEGFARCEHWRGCAIRRAPALGLGKSGKWRRVVDSGALLATFGWELLRMPSFDVVIAMTHPPMIAVVAALARRLKGGHLVSWLMDLNPDEAIAAGWIPKDSMRARLLNGALHFSLSSSDRIVVLDRFMQRRIERKGVEPSKLTVVAPWSHDDKVHYDEAGRLAFRRTHGLSEKFVVMYSGNLSIVHPIDTVLAAAEKLRDRSDIVFCFVGAGNAVPAVRDFASSRRLANILSLPYQPLDRLSCSLSAADLHIIAMGEGMVGIVHPCKIYNVLRLGVPFLHLGPAENHVTDILKSVATVGAGYHAGHGDREKVVAAILDAAERRLRFVDELRDKALAFSQSVQVTKLIAALEEKNGRKAAT